MVTVTEKEIFIVPAFGIEIDHPRNNDILLQGIPGGRLRSAINGSKAIIPKNKDDERIPTDQLKTLGTFPHTPGMQVHVNPKELTYVISDPLHGDEDLCARVHGWIKKNSAYTVEGKLDGVPAQNGELDPHRMKTLCRELFWLVESKHAKRVKGPMPLMKDIEDLPGNFLQNPGSRVPNYEPRFEKDYASWAEGVSLSGV